MLILLFFLFLLFVSSLLSFLFSTKDRSNHFSRSDLTELTVISPHLFLVFFVCERVKRIQVKLCATKLQELNGVSSHESC